MNPVAPAPTAKPTGCRRAMDTSADGITVSAGVPIGECGSPPVVAPGLLCSGSSSAMPSSKCVNCCDADDARNRIWSQPEEAAPAAVSSCRFQEAVENGEMSHRFESDRAPRRPGKPHSASAARVLVVEDSEAIREMVGEALTDAGYLTRTRPDGAGLEDVLEGFRPDLVVLDVMMPGRDGFELIDVIGDWGQAGIVLLTARDGLPDRLRGLDGGADDYVVKPFELAELISRVGAVLRRRGRLPAVVQCGDLTLDLDAAVATRAGSVTDLTRTELRLLVSSWSSAVAS